MSETVRYVGDAFVDAGVSVLEHRLQKSHVDFTPADLRSQATWLTEEYSKKIWAGYLTIHFPNSGWCNATMSPTNRAAFRKLVLDGFDLPDIGRACSYCGRPACDLADRSKIPLLTGAGSMVAGPGGLPGLPVCSHCLYAVQFYPLATLKVEGKPLFWWSADARWLFLLSGEFIDQVSRFASASSDSLPTLSWPSTRLAHTAKCVLDRLTSSGAIIPPADVIGCHATNYGTGPDYKEIRIPKALLEFWVLARGFPLYDELVRSHWDTKTKKKRKTGGPEQADPEGDEWSRRNFFYEDLGALLRSPEDVASAFIFANKYFGIRAGMIKQRSFELMRLFLERMTDVTKDRLDSIERLAGRMAESSRWKDAVDRLFRARNVIGAILEISDRMLQKREMPLKCEDVYIAFDVISEDDSTTRDSYFVRDLILLKILELKGEPALPERESVEKEVVN